MLPNPENCGMGSREFLLLSHKVGIGIEVDFYNLWDLWPKAPGQKKNRLIPLDIKMNQHLHVESCQHETKTTRKHGF